MTINKTDQRITGKKLKLHYKTHTGYNYIDTQVNIAKPHLANPETPI